MFMRKTHEEEGDSDEVHNGKMTMGMKKRMIEEINALPKIQQQPEKLITLTLVTLQILIERGEYNRAKKIVHQFMEIEFLALSVLRMPEFTNKFYIMATYCYFHCKEYINAYKLLRKVSTAEDMNNWALIGCILSKEEDPNMFRSYFKRLLAKPSFQTSPFVVLILGNNFLQKQQFDLALQYYWVIHKSQLGQNAFLNLMLAIVSLCQSYQRTNDNKEQSVRRALAFLIRYCELREDKIEVQYNLARALHYMGLSANAVDLYERLASLNEAELTSGQREVRVRAIYNMAMMFKGSGVSTGAVIHEG